MMRAQAVRIVTALLVLVVGCGSAQTTTVDSTTGLGSQGDNVAGAALTWQSLGCAEPEPLFVESSDALETDVGLAADALAERYGVGLGEAKRRLRLQQVLGERLAEVQAAEPGRVARTELQHEPYFAAVVTLTGSAPISAATRAVLCRTPELEVRLGAQFTQDELATETVRLSRLLGDFGTDVPSFGAGNGRLEFTVLNDEIGHRLDDFLSGITDYPYVINSLQIPPLVLDPRIPFPLLDVTGSISSGVGLSGVLTIEGPCAYLDRALLVLPARETTWNPETGILNTGGGEVMSGDRVIGGGNEYRGALEDLDQPPDPSCRIESGVLQGSLSPIDPSATPAPAPPALPPGDLPGIRVHPRLTGGGLDALVGGVLEVSGSCVWLADSGGSRYPVIWPANTYGRAGPPEIVLPSGAVAHPGDAIQGGGGYVNANRAATGLGLEPFPSDCIQAGDAAVFNSDSAIEVTPGVGVPVVETLVERLSLPQPIGLELIAVNPNQRSVAIVDFVTGTVHQYDPGAYEEPSGAISGASGGGGFIHLWTNGTIYTYGGVLTRQPIVYRPEPLIETRGVASALRVVPSPDGERTWLVQPGAAGGPTLVEFVNLVEERLSRLSTATVAGTWLPHGATIEGLVLVRQDGERTVLVDSAGNVVGEQQGRALSVGWQGAAILRPDGSLVTTDAFLDQATVVDNDTGAEWASVGGPAIPSDSPPLRTGTDRHLARRGSELVVVTRGGAVTSLYDIGGDQTIASWSRGGDWVIAAQGSVLTLVPATGGAAIPLGSVIPDNHWVLSAG